MNENLVIYSFFQDPQQMIGKLALNYSLIGFYFAYSLYEYKNGTKDKVGSMEEERTFFFMLNASVFNL